MNSLVGITAGNPILSAKYNSAKQRKVLQSDHLQDFFILKKMQKKAKNNLIVLDFLLDLKVFVPSPTQLILLR
jgi:hypothetical protein